MKASCMSASEAINSHSSSMLQRRRNFKCHYTDSLGCRSHMASENIIDYEKSRLCLVDDGSQDKTWSIITNYSNKYEKVNGLKLSCNKGHQAALFAGLMESMDNFDATISIDADLQDDPSKISDMVAFYRQGYEIVYGVRNDRSVDSFAKRSLANFFYKFMIFFGIKIVADACQLGLFQKKPL